jgi:hypothetical protein
VNVQISAARLALGEPFACNHGAGVVCALAKERVASTCWHVFQLPSRHSMDLVSDIGADMWLACLFPPCFLYSHGYCRGITANRYASAVPKRDCHQVAPYFCVTCRRATLHNEGKNKKQKCVHASSLYPCLPAARCCVDRCVSI